MSEGDWVKLGEDEAAGAKLVDAVYTVACSAHAHLARATELAEAKDFPSDAISALLPAVCV